MSVAPVDIADPPAPSRPARSMLVAGYTVVLFLNAALLFTVQPMFSKMALPLLGGAPAVWNTCMLVFQALLLGGYLYAHLLSRHLVVARQVALHGALFGASLLVLPIGIPDGWAPQAGGAPVPWLVGLLLAGLGLPFFLLSTAAPLVQQWFARTDHPAAANPYFLYAASNAGSLLALLAYPLVVEPALAVTTQRRLWSGAYVAVALFIVACGVAAARRASATVAAPVAGDEPVATEDDPAVIWSQRLWWTLLALVPSSLLLGVTTYLTTDMAAVPLLWVVPLALYLLTFVIVFARRPLVPHRLALWLHPLALLPLVFTVFTGRGADLRTMAPLHLGVFFLTALVCHGELARLRPPASRLTEFYLWLSVGGVLGGAFNVLLAPVLFERVLEYQIMLAVACALRPWPTDAPRDMLATRRDVLLPLLLASTAWAALRIPGDWSPILAIYGLPIIGTLAAIACVFFVRRPLRLAMAVLGVMLVGMFGRADGRETLFRERSFFGVYTVHSLGNDYHSLRHGTTLHGAQNLRPIHARNPLTYYRKLGPLGDVFGVARLGRPSLRVAAVGLGAGSVACHADRPGDTITFYEIDPVVERIARDTTLFTFLRECAPDADVVLGDARLTLALAEGALYDVIVLDAFSSDAIPVHLLTREAIDVYLSRLAEGGVLALHVSNRYLDLLPVVGNLAADAGVVAMVGAERRISDEDKARLHTVSVWTTITRDSTIVRPLTITNRWTRLPPDSTRSIWTDDHSNVLEVLKR